jgi:hypothetical protein
MSPEATQAQASPVAQSEAPSSSLEGDGPAPVTAEVAPLQANAESSPMPEFAEPNLDPTRAEFMSPVSEAEVAGLAGLVGLGAELQQPVPQSDPATAETTTDASRGFTPVAQGAEQVQEDIVETAAESKPESETVKNTAAAWASWRQIRDTSKGSDAAPQEFEVPQPAPMEAAALAVAAGAEHALQETSSAPPSGNPADVASIVDSVLADLRPKLMAEISRKMAEKK